MQELLCLPMKCCGVTIRETLTGMFKSGIQPIVQQFHTQGIHLFRWEHMCPDSELLEGGELVSMLDHGELPGRLDGVRLWNGGEMKKLCLRWEVLQREGHTERQCVQARASQLIGWRDLKPSSIPFFLSYSLYSLPRFTLSCKQLHRGLRLPSRPWTCHSSCPGLQNLKHTEIPCHQA